MSKLVTVDKNGTIIAMVENTGPDAIKLAVDSVPEPMVSTGRKNNGTLYRSENYEIGILSATTRRQIGDTI